MDREPHRYQKYCSDIAGQDIHSHGGDPVAVVRLVRNWLRNASAGSGVVIPSAIVMVERYERFRRGLPRFSQKFQLDADELTFNDFTTLTAEWQNLNGW